jgi:hypothetical protein
MHLERRCVEAILVPAFGFRGVRVHKCVSANAFSLDFPFFLTLLSSAKTGPPF